MWLIDWARRRWLPGRRRERLKRGGLGAHVISPATERRIGRPGTIKLDRRLELQDDDIGARIAPGGLAAYRSTGAEVWVPHFVALLAGACEIAGQIEESLTLLEEAFQIVERTGERWFEAELHRHRGQLLLQQGHAEAAEDLHRKALGIAVEQEAKLWELRAAVSLARLWRDQGRRAQARGLLTPVYGWFTEGFDMPDLKDAKALLDELI